MVGKKNRILFVCVGNSCRSQMAEGLSRYHGKDRVEARSAGTKPADSVNPKAIEVMRELGIDITVQRPDILTPDMAQWADIIISMGCGVKESCPADIYGNMEDWGIDDPWGQSIEKYREARDEIETRVKKLIDELA